MGAAAPEIQVRESTPDNRGTTVPAPCEAQTPERKVQKMAAFAEKSESYYKPKSHRKRGYGGGSPRNPGAGKLFRK